MEQHAKKILKDILIALKACHNTVTTDVPWLHRPDEQHWRIDNSKEIAALEELEKQLNSGQCQLCGCCNSKTCIPDVKIFTSVLLDNVETHPLPICKSIDKKKNRRKLLRHKAD